MGLEAETVSFLAVAVAVEVSLGHQQRISNDHTAPREREQGRIQYHRRRLRLPIVILQRATISTAPQPPSVPRAIVTTNPPAQPFPIHSSASK